MVVSFNAVIGTDTSFLVTHELAPLAEVFILYCIIFLLDIDDTLPFVITLTDVPRGFNVPSALHLTIDKEDI